MSKPRKPKQRPLKVYEIDTNVISLDRYIEHHLKDVPTELFFEDDDDDFYFNEMSFVIKPCHANDEQTNEIVLTLDDSLWDLLDYSTSYTVGELDREDE